MTELIQIILILIAAVFMWIFLTVREMENRILSTKVKKILIVIIAGLTFTKIGKSALFLVAVLIIFTTFLIKRKNGIHG